MCSASTNVQVYLSRTQCLVAEFGLQSAAAAVTLVTTTGDANRNALPAADAASRLYADVNGRLNRILSTEQDDPTATLGAARQLVDQVKEEATRLSPALAGTVARSLQTGLNQLIAVAGQLQEDIDQAAGWITFGAWWCQSEPTSPS